MRNLVLLISCWLPLAGCIATRSYALTDMPRGGMKATAGALTVVEVNGDTSTFQGPVTVFHRGSELRVERDLLPSATFATQTVDRLEVTTQSPAATAALAIGLVTGLGALVFVSELIVQGSGAFRLDPIHLNGPLY